jgi:hypothetical protein
MLLVFGYIMTVLKILIENAANFSRPLELLYQKSIEMQKVPVDWKRTNVTAIFKKGRMETAGIHRPVSLTSHICKILELIIWEYCRQLKKE